MDKEALKQELESLLKEKGLSHLEDAVAKFAELSLDIVGVIVDHTKTELDDWAWDAGESKLREVLADLVDKIDGVDE